MKKIKKQEGILKEFMKELKDREDALKLDMSKREETAKVLENKEMAQTIRVAELQSQVRLLSEQVQTFKNLLSLK